MTGETATATYSPLHRPGPVLLLRRAGRVTVLSAPDRASISSSLVDGTPPGDDTVVVVERAGVRWVVLGQQGSPGGRVVYRLLTDRCCAAAYLMVRVA